jgi:predicted membrane channel-forming protein YqfA (hemolysin III family)
MQHDKLTAIVLAAAGALCGAVVAKLVNETSWLDARLYIALGLAVGILAAKVLPPSNKDLPSE